MREYRAPDFQACLSAYNASKISPIGNLATDYAAWFAQGVIEIDKALARFLKNSTPGAK